MGTSQWHGTILLVVSVIGTTLSQLLQQETACYNDRGMTLDCTGQGTIQVLKANVRFTDDDYDDSEEDCSETHQECEGTFVRATEYFRTNCNQHTDCFIRWEYADFASVGHPFPWCAEVDTLSSLQVVYQCHPDFWQERQLVPLIPTATSVLANTIHLITETTPAEHMTIHQQKCQVGSTSDWIRIEFLDLSYPMDTATSLTEPNESTYCVYVGRHWRDEIRCASQGTLPNPVSITTWPDGYVYILFWSETQVPVHGRFWLKLTAIPSQEEVTISCGVPDDGIPPWTGPLTPTASPDVPPWPGPTQTGQHFWFTSPGTLDGQDEGMAASLDGQDGNLPIPAIVGGICGVALLLLLVAVIVIVVYRRRRLDSTPPAAGLEEPPVDRTGSASSNANTYVGLDITWQNPDYQEFNQSHPENSHEDYDVPPSRTPNNDNYNRNNQPVTSGQANFELPPKLPPKRMPARLHTPTPSQPSQPESDYAATITDPRYDETELVENDIYSVTIDN